MTKLTGQTPDLAQENIERLKAIFPDVFEEGKIDFEKLKQDLGEYVDDAKERYNFSWNGKGRALRLAQTPSTGTLRPYPGESREWDTTQNLYIEGDNLEVLKLLQKSYHGKVKIIYIDPPYNTGGDFIYPDDFADGMENYKRITKQIDNEGKPLSTNTEANGRYHTDWLNMMYPRLRLARNLLADDGVIFISIDDNEEHNARKCCDEIYGSSNFVNLVAVKLKNIAGASGGGEDKRLKKNMEYVLIYAKNYAEYKPSAGAYTYTPIGELVEQYRVDDISWKYNTALVDAGEKIYVGSTVDGDGSEIRIYKRINYDIQSVNSLMKKSGLTEKEVYDKYAPFIFQTAMPQSSIRPRVMKKVQEIGIESDLYSIEYIPKSGRNKGVVYEQFYKGESFRLFAWLKDVSEEVNGILCKKDQQGTYWDFVGETKNLTKEGGVQFPNGKKPVEMLKRIISLQSDKDSIILDFFSGSSTTAHAVMRLNSDDEGHRRFIMVQIPEPYEDDSEANAGLSNICEIGKARIRRAGDKIKTEIEEQSAQMKFGEEPKPVPDIGFKVFKLDSSNLKKWNGEVAYRQGENEQLEFDAEKLSEYLNNSVDNYMPGRSELDVVYEIMLKLGLDLTYPVEQRQIAGKNVYSIGYGALMMCMDDDITIKVATGMAALYKELNPETWKVVFKDNGFKDDSAKTNVLEILKAAGLEEEAFTTV